jgi:hypothetical protein
VKTLILHGWGGSDSPHWQSYLASELARDYGSVCFPLLKDKDAPNKDVWMAQVEALLQDFQPEIVVCHSLANTLWFHLCNEKRALRVRKLFLVAPPSLTCKVAELETFFPLEFPKDLYAQDVTLITSTNDPYLTQEEAQNLAKSLPEHIILKDAGHINAASGFCEWDEIVKMVKKETE